MAQKTTFSKLKRIAAAYGFEPGDGNRIDKLLVEGYSCDGCSRNLAYRNYRNDRGERCYGVCEKCDFAREFFFNSPVIAAGKRRFSKATE